MGAFALGEPLTDEKLFACCRDKGDSKGSLKFFVTDTLANVHDQPRQPQPLPVIPSFNSSPGPLRPKRRSRQESVSSANEQHILESSGGYEADLDNPVRDRDNNKPAPPTPPHPLPSPPQHHPSSNPPPSPRHARRHNGLLARPISPHLQPPRLAPLPATETSRPELGHADFRQLIPPLSPHRPSYANDENLIPNPVHRYHGRTGSDEHDQALRAAEHYGDVRQLRTRHAFGARLRPQPSKENLSPSQDRRNRIPFEEDLARSDPWVVVQPPVSRSDDQDPTLFMSETTATVSSSQSAARQPSRPSVTSPFSGRSLALPVPPRHPPPVPSPAREVRETRPPPTRPSAGVPLPPKLFAWRGEPRSNPSKTNPWNRLAKGSKSVDNLRAFNHPTTSQPSPMRRHPPIVGRPTPLHAPPIPPYPSHILGVPRSYDSRRPLPMHGSLHGSTGDLGRDGFNPRSTSYNIVTPNQDPYTRPQSALGESTSTLRRNRVHSPTCNGADPEDNVQSPRAISPGRHPYSAHRLENSQSSRSDRSLDMQSGAETSYSTPPHTPISPRSPLNPNRDQIGSSRPSTSDSKINALHELYRGSEATLRPEDRQLFTETLNASSEGTLIASRTKVKGQTPKLDTPLPPATPDIYETTFNSESGSDVEFDEYGTSIWKKRPTAETDETLPILRLPLKVQTKMASPSSSNLNLQNLQPRSFATPPLSQVRRPSTPLKPDPHLAQPQQSRGPRGSTFADRQSSTWAPRPPPEDVYERLEEFFPEHDLDKPVIEASSGGTSPTTVEPVIPAPPTPAPSEREKIRTRNKKSIRIVAEEHKRLIDRSSRGDAASYSNVFRKRSTKLWGSKLEEVTPAQGKLVSVRHTAPDSPTNGSKWHSFKLTGCSSLRFRYSYV